MHPTPQPGSICRVRPHRDGPLPALVLVVAHLSETITRVRLLSNETEMATEAEHLLPRRLDTGRGRPYDLLAHEFGGYVRTTDLEPALSLIDPARDLKPTRAPALTSRADARWDWKVSELERLQVLQPCLAEVLNETDQ